MLANYKSSGHGTAICPFSFVKVIVLDDSEFDRMRVRRLLRATNFAHEAKEASSLAEFKNQIEEQSFDIAILDYELTDGTGLNALEFLNNCPGVQPIGVIMISSHSLSISHAAYENGCSSVIPKHGLCLRTFLPAFLFALGCSIH